MRLDDRVPEDGRRDKLVLVAPRNARALMPAWMYREVLIVQSDMDTANQNKSGSNYHGVRMIDVRRPLKGYYASSITVTVYTGRV